MTSQQGKIKGFIGRAIRALAVLGGNRPRNILSWLRFTFVLTILAVTLGLIAIQVIGLKRSFVIEAKSSLLDLVFSGNRNDWQFEQVTICRPAESPDPRRAASPDAPCPDNIYDIERQAHFTIKWPDGAGARLALDPDGELIVKVGMNFPFLEFGRRRSGPRSAGRSDRSAGPSRWHAYPGCGGCMDRKCRADVRRHGDDRAGYPQRRKPLPSRGSLGGAPDSAFHLAAPSLYRSHQGGPPSPRRRGNGRRRGKAPGQGFRTCNTVSRR